MTDRDNTGAALAALSGDMLQQKEALHSLKYIMSNEAGQTITYQAMAERLGIKGGDTLQRMAATKGKKGAERPLPFYIIEEIRAYLMHYGGRLPEWSKVKDRKTGLHMVYHNIYPRFMGVYDSDRLAVDVGGIASRMNDDLNKSLAVCQAMALDYARANIKAVK